MAEFTHFNEEGRARMVDVSEKSETFRTAIAMSSISVNQEIYNKIVTKQMKKGDVLAVAQVAGVMAAKKTWDIIPMCHPLSLTGIDLNLFMGKKECGFYTTYSCFRKNKGEYRSRNGSSNRSVGVCLNRL